MADRGSFFEIGALWGTDQVVGLRPLRRPPGRRARLRQPPRQRRGDDGRRLRQADPPPRPVRPVPPPGRSTSSTTPASPSGSSTRSPARSARAATWMVAFAQVQRADLHRAHAAQLRRRRQQPGDADARSRTCGSPGRRPTSAASRPRAASRRPTSASSPRPPTRSRCAPSSNARIESVRGPIGPLNRFQMEEMIDPRDTRRLICEWIPTATKVATAPLRLASRPQGYRP